MQENSKNWYNMKAKTEIYNIHIMMLCTTATVISLQLCCGELQLKYRLYGSHSLSTNIDWVHIEKIITQH